MSKRTYLAKGNKKFASDAGSMTERLSCKTDRLVEESIESEVSFSKEESSSTTSLKHDWDSIKLLQEDIRKTSSKLKQLGGIHSQAVPESEDLPKHEKTSKISKKELENYQYEIEELKNQLEICNKEKFELAKENSSLKADLVKVLQINEEMKRQSEKGKNQSGEILKYAQFFIRKLKKIPKWEELFLDRVTHSSNFLSQIKTNKFEECLLNTLQVFSDVIVYNLKSDLSQSSISISRESTRKSIENDESECLLSTITAQSERIAKLNKQISDAMTSSKELLYTPLVPTAKRELKSSKSNSFVSKFIKPKLLATAEKWVLKKDSIPEQNVDEEMSGKPLD
jgi:hypothetical protein